MPIPSAVRVASRYLEAAIVPFRRDREYAAYNIFLKKMKQLAAKVDAADDLHRSSDELRDLLFDAGLELNTRLYWNSDPMVRRLGRVLQGKKDNAMADLEWYQQNNADRYDIKYSLKDEERKLSALASAAAEFDRVLRSRDFADSRKWFEGVSDSDIRTIREGVDAAREIKEEVDYLLKRMALSSQPERSDAIPAEAEIGDVETLYHASVNAKNLYRDGFSGNVPAESSSAGLGGSTSLLSGKGQGISFTYDEYVAKEIARTFKEAAMIARGQVKAKDLLRDIRKHPRGKAMMKWYQENYMPCGRECSMDPKDPFRFTKRVVNEDYASKIKSGEITDYDPRMLMMDAVVPLDEVYPGPEGAMGLYLSYLNLSERYDPKFFVGGPKGMVKRFKQVNPKDIGYIKATVNTTHPGTLHGKGEREVRVPPEAVLSVDKFIG